MILVYTTVYVRITLVFLYQTKVHYNFKYLNWSEERLDSSGKSRHFPMQPLVTMVTYGRTECLSHPLCEKLLQRKWKNYGMMIYSFTTLCYLIFLMCLTLMVITHPSCIFTDLESEFSRHNYSLCRDVFKNHTTFVGTLIFLSFFD